MILYFKGLMVSFAILALTTSCQDRKSESGSTTDASEDAAVETSSSGVPDSGEVNIPGAQLSWTREDTALAYRITYDAPSACYSAGPVSHSMTDPGNTVVIEAEIAFQDGICAQQITTLAFEGQIADVARPFSLSAVLKDIRSGRDTKLDAVPE